MGKMMAMIGLAMVLISAVAQASGGAFCTATCLISTDRAALNGSKILISATGDTKVEALRKLVAQCELKFQTYNNRTGFPVTAQLITEIEGSNGSSWDSSGRYVKYTFDVNKACID